VPAFEAGESAQPVSEVQRDPVLVQALEAVDGPMHLVLGQARELGDLGEEGGRQLVRRRNERVVGVELALDLLRPHETLRAHHLLDLEEHGLPVLEEQGQVVAQGDPAVLL